MINKVKNKKGTCTKNSTNKRNRPHRSVSSHLGDTGKRTNKKQEIFNPFDRRKMMKQQKCVSLKFKDKTLAQNTFKTRWPNGRSGNVLALSLWVNKSAVKSSFWIERALISSCKSVSVYWQLVSKGLKLKDKIYHLNRNEYILWTFYIYRSISVFLQIKFQ